MKSIRSLVVFVAAAVLSVATSNLQAASVWVTPAGLLTAPGGSVSFDLLFQDTAPVSVGSVDVSYDDTRLQFAGFSPNTSLILDPFSIPGVTPPALTEDPTDGVPGRLSALTLANFTTGYFGGAMGTLNFSVLGSALDGNAGISVEPSLTGYAFFSTADFNANNFSAPLTVDFSGGVAQATVVTPLPPTEWLMLSALLLILFFAARRRTEPTSGFSLQV